MDASTSTHPPGQQQRTRDLELIARELAGANLAGQLLEVLHRTADSIAAFDEAAARAGSSVADLEDRLAGAGLAALHRADADLVCAVSRQVRRGGPFDHDRGGAHPTH